MPPDHVRELLTTVWAHDPLTTLKLVCNLHGVRGTGKSDKEGFYAAAPLWMHAEHPKMLACNAAALAEFGYLKDFPELLFKRVSPLHGLSSCILTASLRILWSTYVLSHPQFLILFLSFPSRDRVFQICTTSQLLRNSRTCQGLGA
jgi:hypothetical protein